MAKELEKFKVIIDCDPGVDDSAAIILAALDPRIDVKLITTVSGNRPLKYSTKNALHIVEKFNFDIPVSRGASKPLARPRKDASHIEGDGGLCNYKVTDPEYTKCIPGSAIDNMYKIITENPHEIVLLEFAALTNIAMLFQKYPDAAGLVKKVIQVGGSPFRYKGRRPHVSFNVSSDPEAYDVVVKSGVDLTMVISEIGRHYAYFTYDEVMSLQNYNEICDFIFQIFNGRWEPGFQDKRVSLNDSCGIMLLLKPKFFKTKKGFIEVDLEDVPGKTEIDFESKTPNITVVMKANRRKLYKYAIKTYKSYSNNKK